MDHVYHAEGYALTAPAQETAAPEIRDAYQRTSALAEHLFDFIAHADEDAMAAAYALSGGPLEAQRRIVEQAFVLAESLGALMDTIEERSGC